MIKEGLRQGCILSPTPFSLFLMREREREERERERQRETERERERERERGRERRKIWTECFDLSMPLLCHCYITKLNMCSCGF